MKFHDVENKKTLETREFVESAVDNAADVSSSEANNRRQNFKNLRL